MKNTLFLLLLLALTAASCGEAPLFDAEKEIPGGRWSYKDTLDFSFRVTDTTALYHIYVDFVYADTFPNQNIYVKFYTLFPGGKRLSKPLSFDFFDPLGNPSGECSGGKCRAHIPIQQNAYFNQSGDYTITLEQFGRRDPVSGVLSVGLSIEKSEKKK
ncbi:MAG: gliding motility lipoprotein GldH [Saprospiraceae bacterium]|nr:gliding motility lipoprotein GldH [Saprospiraceae bacterium]